MLDILYWPIHFILHVDQELGGFFQRWGTMTYWIIWLIVFCETGLLVAAVLPGDSLLFAAGTMAARGHLDINTLFLGVSCAAILGDGVNYAIGRYFGVRLLSYPKLFNPVYLEKTKEFYARHGAKSIVLCRFSPIIRTFAPFLAGMGQMPYRVFTFYNVLGGILWAGIFLYAGFYFGQTPIVQKNLTLLMLGIVFVSILPILLEAYRHKKKQKGSSRI
jgi:membrane-associated protein